MEQPRAPDGCSRLADRPSDVQVTVVRAPQRRTAGARVAGVLIPTRALITLVLLGAAVAAVLSTTGGAHVNPPQAFLAAPPVGGDTAGPPPIAAVYRYPLGCLGAAVATGAAVSVPGPTGHAGPCWHYGAFVTAVLHRVRRVWQLGLEAVSPQCPRVSLPAALRAQLVACRR